MDLKPGQVRIFQCDECGQIWSPEAYGLRSHDAIHFKCVGGVTGPECHGNVAERVLADPAEVNQMLITAFVQGAKWWEFEEHGATMWQSDQHLADAEAQRRAEAGTLGIDQIRALADPKEAGDG